MCTTSKLLGQLKVIEEMIASTDAEVINATEGGARVKGTSQMTLKEVMKKYCGKTYRFSDIIAYTSKRESRCDVDSIISELTLATKDLKKVIGVCSSGLKSNRVMSKEVEKNPEAFSKIRKFQEAMASNTRSSTKARELAYANYLLRDSMVKQDMLIVRRSLNVEWDETDIEKVKTRLARNRTVLLGAKEAALKLLPVYKETLGRLQRYQKAHLALENLPDRAGNHFRMELILEELGYCNDAIDEYNIELRTAGESRAVIDRLADCYNKKEQYDRAIACLEKLKKSRNEEKAVEERIEYLKGRIEACLKKANDQIETGEYINAIINARKYLKFYPESEEAKSIIRRGKIIRDEKVKYAQKESAMIHGLEGADETRRKEKEFADLMADSKKSTRPETAMVP